MEEWDENRDGVVDWGEFVGGWRDKGRRMRDFGTGVGHHGDDEYEYEIHHFEKFHDESESFNCFFPFLFFLFLLVIPSCFQLPLVVVWPGT